jgi:hypothetical protein
MVPGRFADRRHDAGVSSVIAGLWHPAQSARRFPTMLAPRGSRVRPRGGDVTTIFILIPALLFALSVAGMVWIRVAAAEYRHNWKVPAGTPPRTY